MGFKLAQSQAQILQCHFPFIGRRYYTDNFSLQYWGGGIRFSDTACYLTAGRHLVREMILKTVRSDTRWHTTTNDIGECCTSPGSTPTFPLDNDKQKQVCFDKALKKNHSQGLNTPFCFNILATCQYSSSYYPTWATSSFKEITEALRDALINSESFLMQVPIGPKAHHSSFDDDYLM